MRLKIQRYFRNRRMRANKDDPAMLY